MAKSGRRTRSRNQSRSQQRTQQRNQQRKSKGKTRKVNRFMQAKEKARKAKQSEFTYNGNTYVRGKTSTGMVIYSRK